MGLEEKAAEIINDLSALDEWFDKYEYLIGLAKTLPPMDEADKNRDNQIHGCQSRVWIKGVVNNNRLSLTADSDAVITRGLAALLVYICEGATPDEVAVSTFSFLEKAGIMSHLSPSRANGLASMVQRIQKIAADYIQPG